ncbi:adenylate/guanylate cyclase domain-containing protein [Pseudovibrio sp. SPO723]|uniref:adenylate/guanylate cyclase domain-containing protein n=1 Tax=Nesiotobacter zosterae TaxID=392721 RepID=UPI0029C2B991|nr:adenylate/guanylate cyclase domain-containing protein [Pseudovibrio sp. SPO723]MDX5594755.1 adenylate/guanylate cyclase domain-containing protein [Pseudovibrio sp. SPO723]
MNDVVDKQSVQGSLNQRLRLVSGLVLFVFALTHFINHALGNISLAAMMQFQDWRYAIWHSWPGTILLYGALIVHVAMALWKTVRRRTLKMPSWEALQLALGMGIPFFLVLHLNRTRISENLFNTSVDYNSVLSLMWPGGFLNQTLLLLFVWIHSCIGLHFWLRLKPWYRRVQLGLLTLAIIIPVTATTGWTHAGRMIYLKGEQAASLPPEVLAQLMEYDTIGRAIFAVVAVSIVILFAMRTFTAQFRKKISINYPNSVRVRTAPGPTLLEISRANRVPVQAVCGGRARCSTCRTLVMEGLDELDPPNAAEAKVLERIGAGKGVRLACQIRPKANMRVYPLLTTELQQPEPGTMDRYRWGVEQPIAVMFIDLRGFTRMAEDRLPYDVVFILNRYVKGVTKAVNQNGGLIDKVMGDGVMALFGIDMDRTQALRAALQTIIDIEREMQVMNDELKSQLAVPLRIGIGLHAGPAIIGRVGLDGGNVLESGLTALGDTVNVASRLETETKSHGATAVVSTSVIRSAGLNESLIGKQEDITVRGRERPLSVTILENGSKLENVLTASSTTTMKEQQRAV